MKIDKVNVKEIDDFGPRVVEVKTKKCSFETPNRAINSAEGNYRVATKIIAPYENEIFEVVKQYDIEKIHKLRSRNGPLKEEVKIIKRLLKRYDNCITKFYPRFSLGYEITIEDVRTLVDLQLFSGFDIVSVIDIKSNSNSSDYERNINDLRRYVENRVGNSMDVVPYLDMSTDEELFKQKLDLIFENNFKAIGIINRSILGNYGNYEYLRSRATRDKDILVHASGVERYWRTNMTTSQVHILQLFGIDTFSLDSRKSGGFEKPPEKIKRYDNRTLGLINKEEHKTRHGISLSCDCPICENKNVDEFYECYSVDENECISSNLLRNYSYTHEVFASHREFFEGRKRIRENDFRDYIMSKEYARNVIEREFS